MLAITAYPSHPWGKQCLHSSLASESSSQNSKPAADRPEGEPSIGLRDCMALKGISAEFALDRSHSGSELTETLSELPESQDPKSGRCWASKSSSTAKRRTSAA